MEHLIGRASITRWESKVINRADILNADQFSIVKCFIKDVLWESTCGRMIIRSYGIRYPLKI